jgi:hypothetical protein
MEEVMNDIHFHSDEIALDIVVKGFHCRVEVNMKSKSTSTYVLELSIDELTRIFANALYQKFEMIVSDVFEIAARKN